MRDYMEGRIDATEYLRRTKAGIDLIGTEPCGTEWALYAYVVFAAAMLFALGFLLGWYLG